MKNIVLTGGGTAGHIMPNIALIDELKKYYDNIYYVGSKNSMEEKIIKNLQIPFYYVTTVKLQRQKLLKNITIPFKLLKGISEAKKFLKEIRPSMIFSKGGYVSLPIVYAAHQLKIPIVAHESDSTIGVANKLTVPKATKLITSFKTTKLPKNGVYIGNPIRNIIFKGDGEKIRKLLAIPYDKSVLLITGGSLGASAINDCIKKSLDELCNRFFVIHITGKNFEYISHKNYAQVDFAYNIQDYLAVADVIISRAGACAASELMALKKKIVFIPLEKGNSRGDQLLNALEYNQYSGVTVLSQKILSKETLLSAIDKVLKDKKSDYEYDKETVKKIVELLCINSL